MSTSGGLKICHHSTLNDAVKQITNGTPIGILRASLETWMASRNISKDHRAQLMSHGISGVQDIHYDQHSYNTEKLAALTTLEEWLYQSIGYTRNKNLASGGAWLPPNGTVKFSHLEPIIG